MKKLLVMLVLLLAPFFFFPNNVSAGWVNGYLRGNGTWVNGYWRTDSDLYKWNNYSFDNNWSNIYNDRSYYRRYGYDPEPWDNEYTWYGWYKWYGWNY